MHILTIYILSIALMLLVSKYCRPIYKQAIFTKVGYIIGYPRLILIQCFPLESIEA